MIAWRAGGGWVGALLRGRSGVGKSDLALRAVATGWRLVADDRVRLWRCGSRVFGAAPAALHGLCEARGQGVARIGALAFAPVALVVELVDAEAEVERQPGARGVDLEGVRVRAIDLHARDASAPVRLLHALASVGSL